MTLVQPTADWMVVSKVYLMAVWMDDVLADLMVESSAALMVDY